MMIMKIFPIFSFCLLCTSCLSCFHFDSDKNIDTVRRRVLDLSSVQAADLLEARSDNFALELEFDLDLVGGGHLRVWGVGSDLSGRYLQLEEIGDYKVYCYGLKYKYVKDTYGRPIDYVYIVNSMGIDNLSEMLGKKIKTVADIIDNYDSILAHVKRMPMKQNMGNTVSEWDVFYTPYVFYDNKGKYKYFADIIDVSLEEPDNIH